MGNREVAPLLEALRSPDSCGEAWAEFLECYSSVLYQSARICTSDVDSTADCYLHICEGLARNGFRRLLKFKPGGSASFSTWLRVVARNLCFDWHRSQRGRPRPFKSLQHFSSLELEVYNCRFLNGSSPQETLHKLQLRFPGVQLSDLSEIEERLQASLSSRQQWILGARRQAEFSAPVAVAGEEDEPSTVDVADPSPSQETKIVNNEELLWLGKSVASLPAQERLLLQLRFEQDLSLHEIASLIGLHDAQRVHRTLSAILKKLRNAMK